MTGSATTVTNNSTVTVALCRSRLSSEAAPLHAFAGQCSDPTPNSDTWPRSQSIPARRVRRFESGVRTGRLGTRPRAFSAELTLLAGVKQGLLSDNSW